MMLPSKMKVLVAKDPVDFRKSYDGLCGVVRDVLGIEPQEPALFVFRNRRGDQVKILWYDRNGFAIWMKRLSRGKFGFSFAEGEVSIDRLSTILKGAEIIRR